MSGFFPEDQHDYSQEAEKERQQLRAEYEYYLKHRILDQIAKIYKSIPSGIRGLNPDIAIIDDPLEQIINEKIK